RRQDLDGGLWPGAAALRRRAARRARRPGPRAARAGGGGLPARRRDQLSRGRRRTGERRAERRVGSGAETAPRRRARRARALDAALREGLLALPRGAGRAAQRERRRARLRAQSPGAACLQRRSDEGARRRLEALEADAGDLAADRLHRTERVLVFFGLLDG